MFDRTFSFVQVHCNKRIFNQKASVATGHKGTLLVLTKCPTRFKSRRSRGLASVLCIGMLSLFLTCRSMAADTSMYLQSFSSAANFASETTEQKKQLLVAA